MLTGLLWGWSLKAGAFVGHAAFSNAPLLLALAFGVGASWGCHAALVALFRRSTSDSVEFLSDRLSWAIAIMVTVVVGAMVIAPTTFHRWGHGPTRVFPLAALVAACGLLLPRQSRRALDTVLQYPPAWRFKLVWLLFPVPLILAAEIGAAGAMLDSPWTDIRVSALLLTSCVVVAVFGVLYALFNRRRAAMWVAAVLYLVFCLASATKLALLLSPLSVLDAIYLPEVWAVYSDSIGVWVWVGMALLGVAGGTLAVLARRQLGRPGLGERSLFGATSVAVLLASLALAYFSPTRHALKRMGIEIHTWGPRGSTTTNGLVVEALMGTQALHHEAPSGYSRDAMEHLVDRLGAPRAAPRATGEPVDLIVYMVEAFWDPTTMGMNFTRDPIPHFRRLAARTGLSQAVSPVFGGLSSNSEMELLTGLSMSLIPQTGTPAYSLFVRRDIPSLPRELANSGYETHAIHVEGLWFQGRSVAYGHLGFQSAVSLHGLPGIQLDAAGRMASDEAVVDRIIATTANGGAPKFVFAFPNSTHTPWNYPAYANSELDAVGTPHNAELKTYINALHTADKAIGRLVAHYEKAPRKTIILVLGDHVPMIADAVTEGHRYLGVPGVEGLARRYGVGAVLWNNFGAQLEPFTLSNNFIAPVLLQSLGVEPSAFFAMVDTLRRQRSIIGHYTQDTNGERRTAGDATAEDRAVLQDYALLQYDVLFGRRYLEAIVRQRARARVVGSR